MNEIIMILLLMAVLGALGCVIADFRRVAETGKQTKGKRKRVT